MFRMDERGKSSGVEMLDSGESRGRMSGMSARVWENIKRQGTRSISGCLIRCILIGSI